MEYLTIAAVVGVFTAAGYIYGKRHPKLPTKKVVIDLDIFEYLKERDDELWEIEKAERSRQFFIPEKNASGNTAAIAQS